MTDTPIRTRTPQRAAQSFAVAISPMRVEDVQHVSRLERRCYAIPWNSSAYITEIGNPSAYYTVARTDDGSIVGYAGMWVIMGEAHVTTIAVDPDARGRKVGERLLLNLLEYGMTHRAHRATLEVREHNVAAHRLYLKYGFVDVAMRKRYYSDNGENAIIMWVNNLFDPAYQALLDERREELRG
jgi:ribosomal-protein-alanine N-acetyltransferase